MFCSFIRSVYCSYMVNDFLYFKIFLPPTHRGWYCCFCLCLSNMITPEPLKYHKIFRASSFGRKGSGEPRSKTAVSGWAVADLAVFFHNHCRVWQFLVHFLSGWAGRGSPADGQNDLLFHRRMPVRRTIPAHTSPSLAPAYRPGD